MEIALFVVVALVCVAMLVAAFRMEPHYVSKDASRFTARVQPIDQFGNASGTWREVRAWHDGRYLHVKARSVVGRSLTGTYEVLARGPAETKGKVVYLVDGPTMAALRVPEGSRSVAALDSLQTRGPGKRGT